MRIEKPIIADIPMVEKIYSDMFFPILKQLF